MRILLFICMIFFVLPSLANNSDGIAIELEKILSEEDVPGMQYVVLDDSGIVYSHYSGFQDIGGKKPVSAKTAFMLNSSTKVFTAAAIMQLVESKKVRLSDSLSQYYASHPYGNKVKIQHLLNQTSGIPNPLPINWLHLEKDHQQFSESEALSATLEEESELSFSPGEKFAYSNISYWLLGKVIENVSGMSFCDYLQENIFLPLNIESRQLGCDLPGLDVYAYGYQKKYSFLSLFFYVMGVDRFIDKTEGSYLRFKRVYHNGPALGGLYGTAEGVAMFLRDMLQEKPRLMRIETKKHFFSRQKDNAGDPVSMTLGWRVGNVDGILFYEKPGGGPGGHSNVRIYPKKNLASVYFINKTSVNEKSISQFTNRLDRFFLSQ